MQFTIDLKKTSSMLLLLLADVSNTAAKLSFFASLIDSSKVTFLFSDKSLLLPTRIMFLATSYALYAIKLCIYSSIDSKLALFVISNIATHP